MCLLFKNPACDETRPGAGSLLMPFLRPAQSVAAVLDAPPSESGMNPSVSVREHLAGRATTGRARTRLLGSQQMRNVMGLGTRAARFEQGPFVLQSVEGMVRRLCANCANG